MRRIHLIGLIAEFVDNWRMIAEFGRSDVMKFCDNAADEFIILINMPLRLRECIEFMLERIEIDFFVIPRRQSRDIVVKCLCFA